MRPFHAVPPAAPLVAAVLPSSSRVRSRADFVAVIKGGRRVGSKTVLVHAMATDETARVGFVVSRSVGGAVTRNRVTRRLRHICRERLPQVTGDVVVRALPAAAAADHAELVGDLHSCLRRAGALSQAGRSHPGGADV